MIKVAKDLNLKFMPKGNRSQNKKHIEKIKQSIQLYGILRDVIIVKTNIYGEGYQNYIVDGQHLYTACKALNLLHKLSVKTVLYKPKTAQEMVNIVSMLNSTQKGWRIMDYIEAFVSAKVLDYVRLNQKILEYNLSPTTAAMIYGGLSPISASQMIKSGDFKIINYNKAEDIAQKLQDILILFGTSNTQVRNNFTKSFIYWYDSTNYNHKSFIKYIEDNAGKLSLMKLNGMEEVLNIYELS